MIFPVVTYGCESWTIKKAERTRIDAFELWCWRRLLRVPTARRSNQSILKEVSPGCSLEGLMLKLKLQYFGHLIPNADSFEKTLMLQNIEGRSRMGPQRISWLDGITNSVDMSWVDSRSWWWTGRPGVLRFMGLQRVRHDWANELKWTESQVVVELLCCIQIFATPWTVAHQAPLPMGFPRQEYWSGLPFPFPGDLPDPRIKRSSPVLQEDSLLLSRQGSPTYTLSPLQCLCTLIVAPYLCGVLASSV